MEKVGNVVIRCTVKLFERVDIGAVQLPPLEEVGKGGPVAADRRGSHRPVRELQGKCVCRLAARRTTTACPRG